MRYVVSIIVLAFAFACSASFAGDVADSQRSISRSLRRSVERVHDCKACKCKKDRSARVKSRVVKKQRGSLTINRERKRSKGNLSTGS